MERLYSEEPRKGNSDKQEGDSRSPEQSCRRYNTGSFELHLKIKVMLPPYYGIDLYKNESVCFSIRDL